MELPDLPAEIQSAKALLRVFSPERVETLLREYGELCARMAVEAAAQICVSINYVHGPHEGIAMECAEAIRALGSVSQQEKEEKSAVSRGIRDAMEGK